MSAHPTTRRASTSSLVPLLGDARAAIVASLRTHGTRTASELAAELGVSDVAVRKHLQVLDDDGFVAYETVKQPRGRPAAEYRLTDRARSLFPHRYAAMASELLDFIRDEHGREGLRAYLDWRSERELGHLAAEVTADDLHDRLDQLAEVLTEAGYAATVNHDDGTFELKQEHCAVYDVAKHNPEMCTHEAATFKRLLGDVKLSRRLTLASGADACVCVVEARSEATGTRPTSVEARSEATGARPSGNDQT